LLPQIGKRRLDYCPFPGPICDNTTQAFEITQFNIGAYELGINSASKSSFSHRTTCAPVDVDEITLWDRNLKKGAISARTTLKEPPFNHTLVDNFYVQPSTANGPNIASTNLSGLDAARMNVPSAIRVLPTVDGTVIFDPQYEGWDHVHQHIRRDDGHSFLIVNIAGRVSYDRPLNDSFFAAHTTLEGQVRYDNISLYFPHREATTLACVDQYEFCIPDHGNEAICSGWVKGENIFARMLVLLMVRFNIEFKDDDDLQRSIVPILQTIEGQSILMDAVTMLPSAIAAVSLHQSMALRNRMIPASGLLRDQFRPYRLEYTDDQWALEVETWFAKAIIDSIFRVKAGAKVSFGGNISSLFTDILGSQIQREWSICGRILFRNAGYTNINVIGFCLALASIATVSGASYDASQTYNVVSSMITVVRRPQDVYARIKNNLGSLMTMFRLPPQIARLTPWSFSPSTAVNLILSQLSGRTPRPRHQPSNFSQGSDLDGIGFQTSVGDADVEADIQMDEIDMANLRRGTDIDDPVGHP
jgi:hypothetical protein